MASLSDWLSSSTQEEERMAAMSDNEHKVTGLELLLPDPEFIAQLGKNRRPDPDEADGADDDYFEPPHAA
jgi:hypothetical protein